jgi:hypothetical protein
VAEHHHPAEVQLTAASSTRRIFTPTVNTAACTHLEMKTHSLTDAQPVTVQTLKAVLHLRASPAMVQNGKAMDVTTVTTETPGEKAEEAGEDRDDPIIQNLNKDHRKLVYSITL